MEDHSKTDPPKKKRGRKATKKEEPEPREKSKQPKPKKKKAPENEGKSKKEDRSRSRVAKKEKRPSEEALKLFQQLKVKAAADDLEEDEATNDNIASLLQARAQVAAKAAATPSPQAAAALPDKKNQIIEESQGSEEKPEDPSQSSGGGPTQEEDRSSSDLTKVQPKSEGENRNTAVALLKFEANLIDELRAEKQKDSLIVLGHGLPSVARSVAHFLSTFTSLAPYPIDESDEKKPLVFPDLIFLINFSDQEFSFIEHHLNQIKELRTLAASFRAADREEEPKDYQIISLQRIAASEGPQLLLKRKELFLKGGAFAITYKQLVVDLLTKRLSPSNISGLIINKAHKFCFEKYPPEAFLAKLIKRDNPYAFIKCFTSAPEVLARTKNPLMRLEKLMQTMRVQHVNFFPRVRPSIKASLDSIPSLKVQEHKVNLSPITLKIHQFLIQLIQICLDEIRRELSKSPTLEGHAGKDILSIENALLRSFKDQVKQAMGMNFNFLGQKSQALLRNIEQLQTLIRTLLNKCCISFLVNVKNYITPDDLEQESRFSIFQFCDDNTNKIIQAIQTLAKARVYVIRKRTAQEEAEAPKKQATLVEEESSAKVTVKKPAIQCSLEKEYGTLYNQGIVKFNWWREEVNKRIDNLRSWEAKYDMQVNYEQMPKFKRLAETLEELEQEFRSTEFFRSTYKKSKDEASNGLPKVIVHKKKVTKRELNTNVVVLVRFEKQFYDIMKYLYQYFHKRDEGRGFFDERLRIHLSTHKEKVRREALLNDDTGGLRSKTRECTGKLLEMHLMYKLMLLLDQKSQYFNSKDISELQHQAGKGNVKLKLPAAMQKEKDKEQEAQAEAKKRTRQEMIEQGLKVPVEVGGNDRFESRLNNMRPEDGYNFLIHNLYQPDSLVDGFNVHVVLTQSPLELEVKLDKLKPSNIFLMEPYLEFMRVIEVFQARRQLESPTSSPAELKMHLMVYPESSEMFAHMTDIEEEKKAFKSLIEVEPHLTVDLRDYRLEEQVRQFEQLKKNEAAQSSRQGGDLNSKPLDSEEAEKLKPTDPVLLKQAKIDLVEAQAYDDKNIIAVDSREFSSSTPIFLHEKGFWVIPMLLTVGDYILSDEICVERKSVLTGDLFESFKSGRLLQQVQNMVQFYKRPVLLIEFDDSIPFKLLDGSRDTSLGAEISAQSIMSKLTLLVLHFPSLQIIWSKGPEHTAEIFQDFKRSLPADQRKDPDLVQIEKIGKMSDLGGADPIEGGADEPQNFNKLLPREFLKRIPGVTSYNINQIMKKVKNMVDLVKLSYTDLKEIVGAKEARMITDFLDKSVGAGDDD